jgi:hypothetical protein
MMRRLAIALARHAAHVLHPANPVQARAMLAELDYVEGGAAPAWAFSCLIASYRQRASLLSLTIVAAQSCVALAAGAFGFLHIHFSFENLRTKLLLLANHAPTPPGTFLHAINAQPLEHWLWMFLTFAAGGLMHIAAAIMMAIGKNRRVLQLAPVIIVFDLIAPLIAAPHAISAIFPAIYIALITLMALVAACFAWLWRWDERRLSPCQ